MFFSDKTYQLLIKHIKTLVNLIIIQYKYINVICNTLNLNVKIHIIIF